MDDHPITIPTRLPTQELTPQPVSALSVNMPTLVNDAQTLLSLIELQDPGTVPLEIVKAAAILHGTLAGPGASDLDLRPGSLEIVGDEALHLQALAEAQRKVLDRRKAEEGMSDAQRATMAEYTSMIETQRESIRNAFEEGKAEGYDKGFDDGYANGKIDGRFELRNEHQAIPLWRIAQARMKAWWARLGEVEIG